MPNVKKPLRISAELLLTHTLLRVDHTLKLYLVVGASA